MQQLDQQYLQAQVAGHNLDDCKVLYEVSRYSLFLFIYLCLYVQLHATANVFSFRIFQSCVLSLWLKGTVFSFNPN